MDPQRYRPSAAALNYLLMIAGYLRDLGQNNDKPLLPPDSRITTAEMPDLDRVSNFVRKAKKQMNLEAQDDDHRLTQYWGAAKRAVEEMNEAAAADPSVQQVLSERRTWNFNEFLPGGNKTLTIDGVLEQLKDESASYFAGSCMNLLGGQVADWLAELAMLPKPPG